jgi:hypothetical protein
VILPASPTLVTEWGSGVRLGFIDPLAHCHGCAADPATKPGKAIRRAVARAIQSAWAADLSGLPAAGSRGARTVATVHGESDAGSGDGRRQVTAAGARGTVFLGGTCT